MHVAVTRVTSRNGPGPRRVGEGPVPFRAHIRANPTAGSHAHWMSREGTPRQPSTLPLLTRPRPHRRGQPMLPNSPSTQTVTSWLDLQRHLFDVSFDTGINRFRQGLVFRGLNSVKYHRMQTSLMRLGGEFAKKERHLIRNFRKYAYLDVNVGDSDWH